MSKDLSWIDYIKAFCMFLVYVNHTEIYYGSNIPYAEILYRPFFVNLFFIVSGYLFFRKYYSESNSILNTFPHDLTLGARKAYISNVVFKIVIPTVLFSVINFFPKKILRHEVIDFKSLLMDTIGGGSLWFTCALAVAQIILGIMIFRRRSMIYCSIISIILFSISTYLSKSGFQILGSASFPWFWKSAFIAVLFMALGGLYWKYEKYLDISMNRNKLSLLLLLLLYLILLASNDTIKCNTISGNVNILGVCATCIISLLLISVFKNFPQFEFIKFIGRNSIGFYFLSGAIPNIAAVIAAKLIPTANSIIVLLLAIIAFGIALIIVKIIILYLPFLFDLRKLTR